MGVMGVIGRIWRVCWGMVYDISPTPVYSGQGGLQNAPPRCYGTRIRGAGDGYE